MKKSLIPLGIFLATAVWIWTAKKNPESSPAHTSKLENPQDHKPEDIQSMTKVDPPNTAVGGNSAVPVSESLDHNAVQPIESNQAQQQNDQTISPSNPQNPDQSESLVNEAREERIRELMTTEGSDLEKYVEVHSIVCKGKTCTIEATAKESPARFQMSMAAQLEKNPWLGNKIKMKTPDNEPGVASITFLKE
jgi:hypothetical protein